MQPCPRRQAMGSRSSTTHRARGGLAPTWNSARRYWSVSKERRLGRGLEALLGRSFEGQGGGTAAYEAQSAEGDSGMSGDVASNASVGLIHADLTHSPDGQQWLPISSISANPYQP